LDSSQTFSFPYHGIPGRGTAFQKILEMAKDLEVKACAVLDPHLFNLTTEWAEKLLDPVLEENFDLVVPLFHRQPYDGTITKSIIYPLIRALYGKRIRQPIGGEFCLSGEFSGMIVAQDYWESENADLGVDTWLVTTALARQKKVCETYWGVRNQKMKKTGVNLPTLVNQIVGSVFKQMEENVNIWESIRGSERVPIFGAPPKTHLDPIKVNVQHMVNAFQLGLREFSPLWEEILSPDVLKGLQKLKISSQNLKMPDDLWVQIIYDFALAFYRRAIPHDHLLKSLTPLYLGQIASFILETQHGGDSEREKKIETLCLVFEKQKEYLAMQWGQSNISGEPS
jgi:hypothetical protein